MRQERLVNSSITASYRITLSSPAVWQWIDWWDNALLSAMTPGVVNYSWRYRDRSKAMDHATQNLLINEQLATVRSILISNEKLASTLINDDFLMKQTRPEILKLQASANSWSINEYVMKRLLHSQCSGRTKKHGAFVTVKLFSAITTSNYLTQLSTAQLNSKSFVPFIGMLSAFFEQAKQRCKFDKRIWIASPIEKDPIQLRG